MSNLIFHSEGFLNPVISVDSKTPIEANIVLFCGANELLKITENGFYVKGNKVEADENEAAAVYRAFKEFLVYHALTKEY